MVGGAYAVQTAVSGGSKLLSFDRRAAHSHELSSGAEPSGVGWTTADALTTRQIDS